MILLDVSLLIRLYLENHCKNSYCRNVNIFFNTGAVLDPTGMILSYIVFIPRFLSNIRKILKHIWLPGAFISRPLLLLLAEVGLTSYLALNRLQVLCMV